MDKKEELKDECMKILKRDFKDGGILNSSIYGVGETLENLVPELVQYLNKDGLIYLKKELIDLRENGWEI